MKRDFVKMVAKGKLLYPYRFVSTQLKKNKQTREHLLHVKTCFGIPYVIFSLLKILKIFVIYILDTGKYKATYCYSV